MVARPECGDLSFQREEERRYLVLAERGTEGHGKQLLQEFLDGHFSGRGKGGPRLLIGKAGIHDFWVIFLPQI